MKALSCLLSVALVASAATPSWAAATLASSQTGVAAITQSGNVRVAVGTTLEGNTRIVVAKGAAGKDTIVSYGDGCDVRLRPGQVYTILDESPCAPPPPATEAAAGGLTGGIGPAAIAGVAIAGAIAGGVLAATGGKSSGNPVYISP